MFFLTFLQTECVCGCGEVVIDVFMSIAFIHSRAESCDSTVQNVRGRADGDPDQST